MKVSVDLDTCDGNGVCMSICHEVFDVQEDGLHLLQDSRRTSCATRCWAPKSPVPLRHRVEALSDVYGSSTKQIVVVGAGVAGTRRPKPYDRTATTAH